MPKATTVTKKKADETLNVAPPVAAPAPVPPAHTPTDIPATVSMENVTMNMNMDKNFLEIVPNMAIIDEFCADHKDQLPTDILKVTKHHDGTGLDERRHDVWGDARTFVELLEHWIANGWRMVPPEEIGALTSGLILESPEGYIFYHENAKIETPAQELVEGRTVKFQGDPANKEMSQIVPEPTAVDTATEIDEDTMKTSAAKSAAKPKDEMPPAEPMAPPPAAAPSMGGGDISVSNWPSEVLIDTIKKLTGEENFASDKGLQESVEALAAALKQRPVEALAMEEAKMATLKMAASKMGSIVHMPGHRNSKGELAPWVNKRTRDGKIISSHATKEEAEKQLRDMEYYKHAKVATALDAFTKAYVEAAMEESDEDNHGRPLSQRFGIQDIAPEALQQMIQDCQKFQAEAGDLISDETYIEGTGRAADDQAGYDFWHSRNGSGVGFWEDADWEKAAGEKLQALADKFGMADLYVGDDGKIYISPMGHVASQSGGSGAAVTDQDTALVLEGDKSVAGQRENDKIPGVNKPQTTRIMEMRHKFTSLDGSNPFLPKQAMNPNGIAIDEDNAKVLEGDKSVADRGTGPENNTGVDLFEGESARKFANEPNGIAIDEDNAKVLEGDSSVADHGTGEENNTGVDLFEGESARKFAAVNTIGAAVKLLEQMVASTKEMYLDSKQVMKHLSTRPVTEGVESLYKATQMLGEALKAMAKKEREDEEAAKLQLAVEKKKKSSLLSNLKTAAPEIEYLPNVKNKKVAMRILTKQYRRAKQAAAKIFANLDKYKMEEFKEAMRQLEAAQRRASELYASLEEMATPEELDMLTNGPEAHEHQNA